MSRARALEAIQLRKTERIPKWIGVPYNAEFLEKLTGMNPYEHPQEASLQAIKELDLDIADYFEQIGPPAVRGTETKEVEGGTEAAFFDVGVDGSDGGTLWRDSGCVYSTALMTCLISTWKSACHASQRMSSK